MKKQLYLNAACILLCASVCFGQDNPVKDGKVTKTITFSSEKEKSDAIKKLEEKINIDLSDPTYPKEDLEKEKKELMTLKETKVVPVKSTK